MRQNEALLRIVRTWKPSERPEYRGFRCADCQRRIRKAWHHLLNSGGYMTPVHFCNSCEKRFRASVARRGTKTKTKSKYKTFTCDKCGRRMRKAWHVWSNDRGKSIEAHFCKEDGWKIGVDKV